MNQDVLRVAEAPVSESVERELRRLLDQTVESQQAGPTPERIDGVRIGTLIGFIDGDRPLVTFHATTGVRASIARTMESLQPDSIGAQVVLVFENGDPEAPIVAGRLHSPSPPAAEEPLPHIEADADGHRVTVTASDQLVLRCGRASITLTAAGKVLIHGEYVSARSSGAMRIRGGSVQIN